MLKWDILRSWFDCLLHLPIPLPELRAQAEPLEAAVVCQCGQQHPVVHLRQGVLESGWRCLWQNPDLQDHHQGSQCTHEQCHWRLVDALDCARRLPSFFW